MILSKNELAKRTSKYQIDWPELVFYAEAENEPFVDVEFVTLKRHCVDLCITEELLQLPINLAFADIDRRIEDKLKSIETATVYEFVDGWYNDYSKKYHVQVGINVDTIDDEAVDYGMSLLTQVEEFTSPFHVELGKPQHITSAQLLKEFNI